MPKDILPREIEVAVVITVCGCPSKITLDERRYNHIQVVRTVPEICVISGYEVTVKDDELW
jgi:hypothetical protein